MNIGVVGAGQWGRNLVRVFHELNSLYGVADGVSAVQAEIRATYPHAVVFQSLEDMLHDPQVDAIALATPAQYHARHARLALEAGKHVFIEKPMTLSVADAEELVQLAESSSQVVMVGHLLLYDPAIRTIKRLLREGAVGEVRSLHQERAKLGRVRAVEDVLWSFGVHDLAVMHYLLEAPAREVTVSSQAVIQPSVADDVHVHMEFPNNVKAHLHVSWLWPENRRHLTIIGSQGAILYNEATRTLAVKRYIVHENLATEDLGFEMIPVSDEKPLTVECQHFLTCIETGAKPESDARQGLEVVRVLERATNLMKEGSVSDGE